MGVKSFRDLEIWKRSMSLAERLYRVTEAFPKTEACGPTAQIRRSALSVPSNIAEGFARSGGPEFRQFLYVAHGSLAELMTQLMLAGRLGYLSKEMCDKVIDEAEQISKMTATLIKRVSEAAALKTDD